MLDGSNLAVSSLDYAAAQRSFAGIKQSKLNDTVLWSLSRYSNPVRAYLHQINTPDSGDFLRMTKNFALAPSPNFLQSYWH
jgi:hypothetical protein